MGPRDFFEFSFTPIFGLAVGYSFEKYEDRPHYISVILPFMMMSFNW